MHGHWWSHRLRTGTCESWRDQIGSVDTRLMELQSRLTGESKSCYQEAARQLDQNYRALLDAGDDPAPLARERLWCLFDAGAHEENTWTRIQRAMESRSRLTEVGGRMQERPRR